MTTPSAPRSFASTTSAAPPQRQAAIIGAGIAGLVAARELIDHGWHVTLWEKSRGVGGRMATRRAAVAWTSIGKVSGELLGSGAEPSPREITFDHGAQYFTARDERFACQVESWCRAGHAARWDAAVVELRTGEVLDKGDQPARYVGVPGMTAIARQLAQGVDIRHDVRIAQTSRRGDSWYLLDTSAAEHGPYSALLITAPAPQSLTLLGDHEWAQPLSRVQMTPCWAVMAAWPQRWDAPWSGAFVHGSPLAWVARNSDKPGRQPLPECWVLQASADWTQAHLEVSRETVGVELVAEFQRLLASVGVAPPRTAGLEPTPLHLDAHRWMFSAVPESLTDGYLYDEGLSLAVAGDWLRGGRVEGAYLSGLSAAEAILRATERRS